MKRPIVLPVLLGAWAVASTASPLAAQTDASDRAAFAREADELRRASPAQYEAVREGVTLFTEMLLGRLGYDVGPFDGVLDGRTKAAVRRYQKDHRLAETGDPFTYETLQAVRRDDLILDSSPISLQPKRVFTDRWTRGYVSADGTWTATGGDLASPEQTTSITCERALAVCREATAKISGTGPDRLLSVDVYTYEIEKWNDEEIVTKPLQFGCTGTVHRWVRSERSVTGVRSITSNEGSCRAVERTETLLTLDDGNAVAERLAEKQRDAWRHLVQVSPAALRHLTAPPEP